MKKVFRIQRQGKVKDVDLRGLASVPAVEDVDSKVAFIQALIPLGLEAVAEALKAEVTALAGEWYSRRGGPSGGVGNAAPSTSWIRSSPSPTSACETRHATRRSPCPPTSGSSSRAPRTPGSSRRSCTA
jgi:hypothetical protein